MCIALPMRVTALNGMLARCERPGKSLWADTALAGSVAVGDYVLVFREAILRRTNETEARQIEAALTCVDAVMTGSPADVETAFADILEHTGELPPHLRPCARGRQATGFAG